MTVKEQYLEATQLHRRVTRVLYEASPEIQPWNGDPFTFEEVARWGATVGARRTGSTS
jgi:hypothetical protein